MDDGAKRIIIVFLLVILVIAIGFIVYVNFFGKSDKTLTYGNYVIEEGHNGSIQKYDASSTVEGYKGSKDKAYYVMGKVSSSEDKDFTIITFNLYDKDNKLLGTAVAGINKMKKNQKYPFKALALVNGSDTEKIDHYKLKDIKLGN